MGQNCTMKTPTLESGLFDQWRVLLALAIPLLALTLIAPIGFDNSVYQSMAVDLVRFGKVPYIGSWDVNFPGNILIHIAELLLFGNTDLGFRAFDVLLQLGFVFLLHTFLRRWLTTPTALVGVALYLIWYVGGGEPLYAERDVFIGMMLIGALTLLTSDRHSRSKLVLAALAVGFGISTRPTTIGFAALFCLLIDRPTPAARYRARASFLVLTLLPIGLMIVPYLFIENGLYTFYISTIRFVADLYTKFGSEWIWFFRSPREAYPIAALSCISFILACTQRGRIKMMHSSALRRIPSRRESFVLFSSLLLSLGIVLLQGKFFKYHYAPLVMLSLPLAAIGAVVAVSRFKESRRTLILSAVGIVLVLGFIRWHAVGAFASKLPDLSIALNASYCVMLPDTNGGKAPELAALAYLRVPKNANATIEIISFDAHLRADLARECVSRYTTISALAVRSNPTIENEASHPAYQQAWRTEYVELLRTKRPQIIVIGRHFEYWYLHDIYDDFLHTLPGFDSLLTNSYQRDTTFGGYEIYRLR